MMSSVNIPETLGNLTNLQELHLSENQLSGTYPTCFQICAPSKKNMEIVYNVTIPVKLLRMKTQGTTVLLSRGLMLPENIRDICEDITSLDLSNMGLIGKCVYRDLRALSH
jgi:hypothetical protein